MFFSTLALMFTGMSFYVGTSQSLVNKNFYFTNPVSEFGGNIVNHPADEQQSLWGLPTTLNSRTKIFQCDIEGEETNITDGGTTITTTNTLYRGYFSIYATLRSTYYEIEVVSPYYDRVAPSCFIKFNYYDGGNEIFEFYTPTFSSVGDYEIYVDEFYFEEWDVAYTDLNFCVDVYCVKTIDYDPSTKVNVGDDYGEGYDNGYTEGYDSGKQDGLTEGYDNGYSEGSSNGYNTGYTQGYNTGMSTALSTHSFSFTNLFASISDTPILMIRRLFGFEIFGTSVMAIFMSLFTALVVIKVIKKVF